MRADVVLGMTGKQSFEEGEKAIDRIYEITVGDAIPADLFRQSVAMIELPDMDAELQAETASRFQIDEVHPYSSGQDFVVARGTSRTLGPLALRYPQSTYIDDGIDEKIDAVELLRQEALILSDLSLNGGFWAC